MRKLTTRYAAVACLALGGCHLGLGHPKAPAGQVAATVDGKEITQRQLRAEVGDLQGVSAPVQKAAEVSKLRQIIVRTAVAAEARKEGLDKAPDFAIAQDRATDDLLAQALENKVVSAVPAVTPDEAQRYVTDHPELFSERKVFVLDQIRAPLAADPNLPNEMKPINTLPDAVNLLNSKHIPFSRSPANLDSLSLNAATINGINKLPAQALFMFASGGELMINQVQSSQVQPVTGDNAVKVATQLLTRQRRQEAVTRSVQEIMSKAAKTISYNPIYAPKPAAAAPKPATPSN